MTDQPDQALPVILHEHMPDVLPVHQTGHEFDEFVLIHGEEVRRHELLDGGTAHARPDARLIDLGNRPFMHREPVFLPFHHGSGEGGETLGPASPSAHAVVGSQLPLTPRLARANALVDDTQVALDVRLRDA